MPRPCDQCHSAPPEKAKDEFDPIALEEVKCLPSGFTKWDRTWVDKGDLTLREFLEAFSEITGEAGMDTSRRSSDFSGCRDVAHMERPNAKIFSCAISFSSIVYL